MLQRLIIFLLMLFTFDGLFAQKDLIRFQNITIDNGLAQGTITGIVHGQDGYMWISTAEGLHRYDGYAFKIYRNDPSNKSSLPDNYISSLFEDAKGNLILGLYSGEVCMLDKNSSTFKNLNINVNRIVKGSHAITCINEDGRGSYLIGLEDAGLLKYDTAKHQSKLFRRGLTSGLNNNTIRCIVKDAFTGKFWVGTAMGVCEYDATAESFIQTKNLENISDKPISSVLTPAPDKLLFGTYGKGLYQYTRGQDSASRLLLPKSKGTRFISFLKKVSNNEIWIGTGGGLMKWEGEKITLYMNNPLNPESLVDNNTQTGCIDRFGSIWVGTINGLSRFDKRLKLFNLFREFRWKDSLLNNVVYHIYEDTSSSLWIGTLNSGILKFNPKTEQLTAWPVIKFGNEETRMVRTIFRDRSGQLWLGSRDKGLFKFYPEQNRFESVTGAETYKISSVTIRSIFEDKQGNFWIGTDNGINLYDRKTNKFEVFRAFKESPKSNSIYQIGESPDGQYLYLACFRGGFQIFDKTNKTFRSFSTGSSIKKDANKSYAMCFELLSKDSVMVGTYGGGICIINLKTGKSRSITEKQGLANNSVYGILRDGDDFWLSTNRGLSCFNIRNNRIQNFGLKNYIQSNEFNEGAYCKTSDGTFYFGGVNGFNYFKPSELLRGEKSYKMVITAIKKGDEEVPFLTDKQGEKFLKLHYNDNLIAFEFATLNFLSTQSNQYAYKLVGFDDKWIKAGNRTVAYYTKLSPGEYIFKVRALDGDSISTKEGASVKIVIEPPFWRTWWFYLLIALLIFGLIYLIFKWRTQIIDRNYSHKLAELELKALRSQMNPHFIFNSLNSIQYFILKKEPKAAYNYLTKFSTLMRMILQNSKHKSISLKAEHDWLQTYLELENLRMEDSLVFNIILDKNINPEQIFVPTMVLQPYVENAIIHGLLPKEGIRKLDIEIFVDGQKLKCIITDNGIGRSKSHELNKARLKNHESTAMNLTKDRLAILNIETGDGVGPQLLDLYDEAGNSLGTKVELILPLIIKNEVLN